MTDIVFTGNARANAIGFAAPDVPGLVAWYEFGTSAARSVHNRIDPTGATDATVAGTPTYHSGYATLGGANKIVTPFYEGPELCWVVGYKVPSGIDTDALQVLVGTNTGQSVANIANASVGTRIAMASGGTLASITATRDGSGPLSVASNLLTANAPAGEWGFYSVERDAAHLALRNLVTGASDTDALPRPPDPNNSPITAGANYTANSTYDGVGDMSHLILLTLIPSEAELDEIVALATKRSEYFGLI